MTAPNAWLVRSASGHRETAADCPAAVRIGTLKGLRYFALAQ